MIEVVVAEAVVAVVAAASAVEGVAEAASAVEEVAEAAVLDPVVPEKCIRQLVQIAVLRLKYLLFHPVIDQCTAENVTRSIGHRDN
jgi:hypothetical protein